MRSTLARVLHRLRKTGLSDGAQASKPAVWPAARPVGRPSIGHIRRFGNLRYSRLGSLRYVAACLLLAGCTTERWQLSTAARKADFKIRDADELFSEQGRLRSATNELVYVEPAAHLVDYAYDSEKQELEITVEVNRDSTITLAGPRAGVGKQVRLSNYQWLSRAIRLKSSTGWVSIGSRVALPRKEGSSEEHAFTLLLGLALDAASEGTVGNRPQQELTATLESLIVYDHDRNLVLAEWKRQAPVIVKTEPEPRE